MATTRGQHLFYHINHDQVISDDPQFHHQNWFNNASIKPRDISVCEQMKPDEAAIWYNLNQRRNVLVSGIAGSGKSHLLQRFIHNIKTQTSFKVRVTAPTGIAANNINGETIYRALGLGLANESPEILWNKIQKKLRVRREYNGGIIDFTLEFLEDTQILIIDEISMLVPQLINLLDLLFRRVRGKPLEPFGGVLLIMFGDFLQLGPIHDCKSKPFVFCAESFMSMSLGRIHLCHNFRQGDTNPFLDILNSIRIGELTEAQIRVLQTRLISNVGPPPINSVHLYCRKNDVETKNSECLQKLITKTNPLHHFKGEPVIRPRPFVMSKISQKEKSLAQSKLTEAFLEDCFVVRHVTTCIGAIMMIRSNHYFDQGLFNGSLVKVVFIGTKTVMVPNTKPIRYQEVDIIQVECSKGRLHDIQRITFSKVLTSHLEVALEQFPLCLAWAMTIHKSQGLTLDSITIDLRNGFSPGQMYVGLSRVRSLEDIFLIDFKYHSLFVHEKAIEFENIPNPFLLPQIKQESPKSETSNEMSNENPQQVKSEATTFTPTPIKPGSLRDLLLRMKK